MAEDKTRHQEKWAKAVLGLATKVWKGGLLLAWFLSMTEGLSWWTRINQGECVDWLFLARFGSNILFLVIEWHRQPADIRLWRLVIISSSFSVCIFILFMFTLFTRDVAKGWRKDWATWGGEAEPRGSNGLCRRSKEDRAKKTKICGKATPWLGRASKPSGR